MRTVYWGDNYHFVFKSETFDDAVIKSKYIGI